MNLLAERVGDNWRAISLLSAAMALSACTVITQAPTTTSPTVTPPLDEMRPLTPTEKAALAKTLSQTINDPMPHNSSGFPSPRVVAAPSAIAAWLFWSRREALFFRK